MTVDPFAERLAKVRRRFVSTLPGKIDGAYGAAQAAPAKVAEAYQSIHGIVGIGPTVGFPSTGRAAREVEDVLRSPYRDRRGLTADEVSLFMQRLEALHEAASCELHSAAQCNGAE
jgi:hypothetical protein